MQIELTGVYGDERKKVLLTNHSGGGSNWHLYIGGYYYGAFNEMLTGWTFYGNDPAEAQLTTDDRQILLDMILECINEESRD